MNRIWRDIPAAKRRQNADLRVLLATRRAERERDQMKFVDATTAGDEIRRDQ